MHARGSMGFGATRFDSILRRVMCAACFMASSTAFALPVSSSNAQLPGTFVVYLRRARRERVFGIGDRRPVAILHRDQLGGILRRSGAVRDDDRHRFADEVHLAVSEHRPVGRDRLHAVLAREGERVAAP